MYNVTAQHYTNNIYKINRWLWLITFISELSVIRLSVLFFATVWHNDKRTNEWMNVPTAIKRLEVYKSSLDQIFEKCTVDIDPLVSLPYCLYVWKMFLFVNKLCNDQMCVYLAWPDNERREKHWPTVNVTKTCDSPVTANWHQFSSTGRQTAADTAPENSAALRSRSAASR